MGKLSADIVKSLYWEKEHNIREIAQELGVSFWALYNFMNKNNINRRMPSECNYIVNKDKPRFENKLNICVEDEKIKIAGIMLYWAEGTLIGNTVDFANSNPEMVKTFLKFLRDICGVSEERLRVYFYAYPYHDIEKIKGYWHNVTKIPLSQFTKPYIRRGNQNLSNRKLPYGLVHIRYNDKRLLVLIENWINEYVIWAGTQVAKGGRLCKRSVLSKGRMEK